MHSAVLCDMSFKKIFTSGTRWYSVAKNGQMVAWSTSAVCQENPYTREEPEINPCKNYESRSLPLSASEEDKKNLASFAIRKATWKIVESFSGFSVRKGMWEMRVWWKWAVLPLFSLKRPFLGRWLAWLFLVTPEKFLVQVGSRSIQRLDGCNVLPGGGSRQSDDRMWPEFMRGRSTQAQAWVSRSSSSSSSPLPSQHLLACPLFNYQHTSH